jgi:hypothetical protein
VSGPAQNSYSGEGWRRSAREGAGPGRAGLGRAGEDLPAEVVVVVVLVAVPVLVAVAGGRAGGDLLLRVNSYMEHGKKFHDISRATNGALRDHTWPKCRLRSRTVKGVCRINEICKFVDLLLLQLCAATLTTLRQGRAVFGKPVCVLSAGTRRHFFFTGRWTTTLSQVTAATRGRRAHQPHRAPKLRPAIP